MPSEMTISKVVGSREWKGQHGPMVTYKVELEELEGVHELNQKPETSAPQVGESLFADVLPPSKEGYPPKLKKAQKQGGGNWNRKDDSDQRSIERQVAAKCATDLAVAGKIQPTDIGGYIESIARKIEGS